MNKIFETYRPDDFGSVSPYLFAADPIQLIEFLQNAFYAEEKQRLFDPKTNEIINVIMKIGSTAFMIGRAQQQFTSLRASFYLYVDDVDLMHERALKFGAKEEFEPQDMPYKDRQSGVIDPAGNYWWISKRLENKNYHE